MSWLGPAFGCVNLALGFPYSVPTKYPRWESFPRPSVVRSLAFFLPCHGWLAETPKLTLFNRGVVACEAGPQISLPNLFFNLTTATATSSLLIILFFGIAAVSISLSASDL